MSGSSVGRRGRYNRNGQGSGWMDLVVERRPVARRDLVVSGSRLGNRIMRNLVMGSLVVDRKVMVDRKSNLCLSI